MYSNWQMLFIFKIELTKYEYIDGYRFCDMKYYLLFAMFSTMQFLAFSSSGGTSFKLLWLRS